MDRDDLAAIIAVGVGAASIHRLVTGDYVTRNARYRLVRYLNAQTGRWATYALVLSGCVACSATWYSAFGHLARRRRLGWVGTGFAVMASRAVAVGAFKALGWEGEWAPVKMANGTIGLQPSGLDWPDDVAPWSEVITR
jgi:hypothetical protein